MTAPFLFVNEPYMSTPPTLKGSFQGIPGATDPGICPAVYGPVQSRRHGKSLGVNLGNADQKICTWGCIYCQCGFGKREELLDVSLRPTLKQISQEIKSAVMKHNDLDSITFAGNSEPTSHPEFFSIVREVQKIKYATRGKWIINVLSNGSELHREDVIRGCDLMDEAWIKLDCADEDLFRRLNRPLARIGSVTSHVLNIKKLKKPLIQTLFWAAPERPEISNWTEENKKQILKIYSEIMPKKVHIATLSRNPATTELKPLSESELNAFSQEVRKLNIECQVFSS